ncbi:hypothetical protein [Vibrio marisflavi]|uniref:Uncharacterized protein n=1 Tax=Vibrio marisflavi CECT 7928 TaxID=634439 RepID=A0ABN8EBH2_9VIBR|nr:hypothetical protein [Vibrio marisflavi]CAH0542010.1 hypothetical protein VMF7928_04021 [Vibrio marisflavi CECT 7928]
MAKRFCKMNRQEIASSLGYIHQLVSVPKYICQSCVRTSSYKGSLCKPSLIPQSETKPQALQDQDKSVAVATVHSVSVEKPKNESERSLSNSSIRVLDSVDKGKSKSKKLKKKLSKQKKQCKKLKKLLKKQSKLQAKHAKLQSKIYRLDGQLTTTSTQAKAIIEAPLVH